MIKKFSNLKTQVLIAEDDPVSSLYLSRILSREGYNVTVATNGEEAMRKYKENHFDIIVSDLSMPVMNGKDLLKQISCDKNPPLFLVETEDNSNATIIDVMKMGATDYILKPVQEDDFIFKISRALELIKLRKVREGVLNDREKRLDKHIEIEWMKERLLSRGSDQFDRALFASMKNSFNQGAGIGAMVTLTSVIKNDLRGYDDFYLCKRDKMDLLLRHSEIARRALERISDLSDLSQLNQKTEKFPVLKFYQSILEVMRNNQEFIDIGSHNVLANDPKNFCINKHLVVNINNIQKAVLELLINALKFSEPGSDIYFFCTCSEDNFFISFINKPDSSWYTSKFSESELFKNIFQPFYRLANFVKEEYDTLDLGLGLPFVEKLVHCNRGRISVSRLMDESDLHGQKSVQRLNFEISLPVYQDIPVLVNSKKINKMSALNDIRR